MDDLTGDPDYSLSRVHAGTPIHQQAVHPQQILKELVPSALAAAARLAAAGNLLPGPASAAALASR